MFVAFMTLTGMNTERIKSCHFCCFRAQYYSSQSPKCMLPFYRTHRIFYVVVWDFSLLKTHTTVYLYTYVGKQRSSFRCSFHLQTRTAICLISCSCGCWKKLMNGEGNETPVISLVCCGALLYWSGWLQFYRLPRDTAKRESCFWDDIWFVWADSSILFDLNIFRGGDMHPSFSAT